MGHRVASPKLLPWPRAHTPNRLAWSRAHIRGEIHPQQLLVGHLQGQQTPRGGGSQTPTSVSRTHLQLWPQARPQVSQISSQEPSGAQCTLPSTTPHESPWQRPQASITESCRKPRAFHPSLYTTVTKVGTARPPAQHCRHTRGSVASPWQKEGCPSGRTLFPQQMCTSRARRVPRRGMPALLNSCRAHGFHQRAASMRMTAVGPAPRGCALGTT